MESTPLESHPEATAIDELRERLARALASSPPDGFLSVSLTVPSFPGTPGLPAGLPALWWGRPGAHHYRASAGRAWEREAQGPRRFAILADAYRTLRESWRTVAPEGSPGSRTAFLGFAFNPDPGNEPFPNALLSVPRVVVERRGAITWMHFNGRAEEEPEQQLGEWLEMAHRLFAAAGSTTLANTATTPLPPPTDTANEDPGWAARVAEALDAIENLSLEKLVLTRRLHLTLPTAPDLNRVLGRLVARYPDAALFAVQCDHASLVGASPERLLGLEHGIVVADALAGSAPRAACGATDRQLGDLLLGSPKELAEHEVVVREILAALEPLCSAVMASHAPALRRLANVQHLASQVYGRVRPSVGLFELLERMHPTPAVGGAPRQAALDWLRQHGEADRGWYTGGIGWLDDCGGDLWVALRCALLHEHGACLYAGAGIVAGSDAEQELRETGWKLRPMLEALAGD